MFSCCYLVFCIKGRFFFSVYSIGSIVVGFWWICKEIGMLCTLGVYHFTGFSFGKNIVSAPVALSFFVSLFSEFIFIFKECGWLNLPTFKIIFTISKVRKLHDCDCFPLLCRKQMTTNLRWHGIATWMLMTVGKILRLK